MAKLGKKLWLSWLVWWLKLVQSQAEPHLIWLPNCSWAWLKLSLAPWLSHMETRTVKLPKPLPNMLRQVMPMIVVVLKLSRGSKDLRDPKNNHAHCQLKLSMMALNAQLEQQPTHYNVAQGF